MISLSTLYANKIYDDRFGTAQQMVRVHPQKEGVLLYPGCCACSDCGSVRTREIKEVVKEELVI